MKGIFIPDCTQEEIAEILMYARIGANNSMFGVHKHYISVEDTDLQRWIPTCERMPEYSGLYLVSVDDLVTTMQFDGYNFRNRGGVRITVSAWQILPEPFKKGGAE